MIFLSDRERVLFTGARASTPGLLEGRPLRSLSLDNQMVSNAEPMDIIQRSNSVDPGPSSSSSLEMDGSSSSYNNCTSNAKTNPNFILRSRIIEENEQLVSPVVSPVEIPALAVKESRKKSGHAVVSPSLSVSDREEAGSDPSSSPGHPVSDRKDSLTEEKLNSVCKIISNGVPRNKSESEQYSDIVSGTQVDSVTPGGGGAEGTYVCTLTVNNEQPRSSPQEREETKF